MNPKIDDIESLILDIERAEITANDAHLNRNIREDALVQFVRRVSGPVIALLDELKDYRARQSSGGQIGEGGGPAQKTHRVILEGFSDKGAEAALSTALDKAAHYFAEDHDVSITVQQLIELPGGGHRATLEVRITPFSLRNTAHLKNADIELKRDHDKAYKIQRHKEEDYTHHLIYEHFSSITNSMSGDSIPPAFLIDVSDAKILHYMLEKQFLQAEQSWENLEKNKDHDEDSPAPNHKIMVHFKKDME